MSSLLEKDVLLDDRLRAVADFIPEGAFLADIGCDHGYLGAWLLLRNRVSFAELTDISAPSLAKAERLLRGLGLADRACFSVGNGALALSRKADCAVIAGMGGQTIIEILKVGREKLKGARVIMQANVCQEELRAYLGENGYRIIGEKIARAARRRYVIIAAEPGEAKYTKLEILCGPELLKNGDPLFPEYVRFRMNVAKDALSGAEKTDLSRATELRAEIELWEEGLACAQRLKISSTL